MLGISSSEHDWKDSSVFVSFHFLKKEVTCGSEGELVKSGGQQQTGEI